MDRLQTWLIHKNKLCLPLWKNMSTKYYLAFSAITAGATVAAFILLYWFFGGLLALIFLLVSITGKRNKLILLSIKAKFCIHLFLIGFFYYSEDCLLYYPDLPDHSRIFVPQPSMYGMPFENIYIKSLDGTRLHLFLIKQPGKASKTVPTLLFLHGNAGNIGHR